MKNIEEQMLFTPIHFIYLAHLNRHTGSQSADNDCGNLLAVTASPILLHCFQETHKLHLPIALDTGRVPTYRTWNFWTCCRTASRNSTETHTEVESAGSQ